MSDDSHEVPASGKRLAIVILLNFSITITEVIGSLISGSLSLLSDALHNFSDGIAIIIAWIAIRLNARPRNEVCTTCTCGRYRSTTSISRAI